MVKNKRKNQKKRNKKSANNESESAAPSTSNTSDVNTDGMQFTKGNNRSNEDVRAAGQSTQNAAEEKDKKSSYRSIDDIGTTVQCSLTPESDLIDEDIKGQVDVIIECKKSVNFREMALFRNHDLSPSRTFVYANYVCSSKNKSTLEMLLRILNERLADRDPDFVKFLVEYINKQTEFSYLQKQVSSATEMVPHAGAGAYEEIRKSKEQDDANAQITMVTAEMEYGPNKASLNLRTVERKLKEHGNANAQVTMATAELEHGPNEAISDLETEEMKSNEHGDANAQVTMATAELEYRRNEASLDLETKEMKPKEQGDANAQVTMATAELEYGRNEVSLDLETEKRKKQMGGCDISADDIQKPACTPHNVEVKNDGKNDKSRNRCTDDNQSKGDSPQNVTLEMEDNKSMNTSPEDNTFVDQCSQSMDLGFDEEVICRELGKIMIAIDKNFHESTHSENMVKPLSSRERKSRLDSIAKRHRESNAFLMSQNPKLAKDAKRYMDIQSEIAHLKRLRNMPRSSAEEAGTTAKKVEIQEETKDSNGQTDYANDQGMTKYGELENKPKELEKDEEKKDANEIVRCIVDSEKADHSPHHFLGQKQEKQDKGSNRYADKIQSTVQSSNSQELDHDDKTLTKIIDNNEDKPKDIPLVEHSNKRKKAQNKPETLDPIQHGLKEVLKPEHSKLDKYAKTLRYAETALNILKQTQAADASKGETDVYRRLSIEAANELIKQVKKDEIEKIVKKDGEDLTHDFQKASHSPENAPDRKKYTKDINKSKIDSGDSQTAGHSPKNVPGRKKDTKDSNKSKMDSGDTQTAGHSPKNVTEDRKEGNKGTKYVIKSTSDLQVDEYPDFDIDKSMNSFEATYQSDEKFRRDLKGFFKLQNSKLDEQMEESSVVKSDLKPFKEHRDKLPTEKKSVTSTAEAQCETVITPEAKDNAIEDSTTFDPNEVIIRLDKNPDIKFFIKRNGFKTLRLSSDDVYYRYAKRYNVTYDFKHEKVQVSFNGDQILVRTQNSEFEISVRKAELVDLKDDATQTDDKS